MEAKHCLPLAAASTDTHTAQTWHHLQALVLLILSFVDYCSVCWFYCNHSDKGSWTRAHCSWFLLTGDVNPINSQNFVKLLSQKHLKFNQFDSCLLYSEVWILDLEGKHFPSVLETCKSVPTFQKPLAGHRNSQSEDETLNGAKGS